MAALIGRYVGGGLRNVWFWLAKAYVLACKRYGFALQKVTFWFVVILLLMFHSY